MSIIIQMYKNETVSDFLIMEPSRFRTTAENLATEVSKNHTYHCLRVLRDVSRNNR